MDRAFLHLYEHFGLYNECRTMLDEAIGAIALDSLAAVALPDCRLTLREKIGYIREFVDSEYGHYIASYGRGGRASVTGRLQSALARWATPTVLYGVIAMRAAAGRAVWRRRRARSSVAG